MGIEIERKFLVHDDKWSALAKPAGTHYNQGYIINNERGAARVRVAGERAYITFKGASSSISRAEFEYPVPVNEAQELLKLFAVSSVEKIRYLITYAGKLWEVDVFLGDNMGLIVAEIELQSEDELFELPEWVSTEVTHEDKYFNSNLSIHPYKMW
jgi:adenylate cyclase